VIHIPDGEIRVPAAGDAALARKAENTLRAVGGEIHKTLQRHVALV